MKLILLLLAVIALIGFLGYVFIHAMVVLALIGLALAYGGSFWLFVALFGPQNQALALLAAFITGTSLLAYFLKEKK